MSSSDTSADGGRIKSGPDLPQKLHVGATLRLAIIFRKDSQENAPPGRVGTCVSLPIVPELVSSCTAAPRSGAMSKHLATHSEQIVTVGPAINLMSDADLPQKLQALTVVVAILAGLPFWSYHILLAYLGGARLIRS
jgi:hypothetical protein